MCQGLPIIGCWKLVNEYARATRGTSWKLCHLAYAVWVAAFFSGFESLDWIACLMDCEAVNHRERLNRIVASSLDIFDLNSRSIFELFRAAEGGVPVLLPIQKLQGLHSYCHWLLGVIHPQNIRRCFLCSLSYLLVTYLTVTTVHLFPCFPCDRPCLSWQYWWYFSGYWSLSPWWLAVI